ncbi:Ig-like domain-containing protein [Aeromonas simiae]|uniref:Ig-like domain-containing protein n=1 Tax=Aeromonas simiae TaxID=218936 RepID=UPI001868447A|nr:Ig-like domain-containing protein [Aeromonas simiae]
MSIDTERGTLQITGIQGGDINYTYTLSGAQTHAEGEGNNTLTESITITVADQTGDSASGDLVITIVDDMPTAMADTIALQEIDGQGRGNVLDNDRFGADGGTIMGVAVGVQDGPVIGNVGSELQGQYGTLILNADGSYHYMLTADVPAGEAVEEQFTYTLKDGDGDTSTTTITVSVQGDNQVPTITFPGVGEEGALVYESDLDEGSSPSGDRESTSGTVTVTLNGEAGSVTIGDKTFMLDSDGNATLPEGGVSIDTERGTLQITGIQGGDINYTYTLSGAQTHAEGEGNNTLTESITITVADQTGDSASGDLVITIVDDMPTAMADTIALQEIDGQGRGNVLDNDSFGADGGTIMGVAVGVQDGPVIGNVGSELQGQYGTLILNADGSYHYVLTADVPAGEAVEEQFTYTLKDGDGDTSTTTITVSVQGDNQVPTITFPGVGEEGALVYESDLDEGSSPSGDRESISGTITVTLNGEAGSVTIGDKTFTLDSDGNATLPEGGVSIDTERGTLQITGIQGGDINYTYTLSGAQTHAEGEGNNTLTESITITVADQTGDSASGDLVITIVDDVPTIDVTEVTSSVANRVEGEDRVVASGTLTVNHGADGVAQKEGMTISYDGEEYEVIFTNSSCSLSVDLTP